MDREQILSLLRESGLTAKTVWRYCVMQDKPYALVNVFIQLIIKLDMFEVAIGYILARYEINILRDSQGNIIKYF